MQKANKLCEFELHNFFDKYFYVHVESNFFDIGDKHYSLQVTFFKRKNFIDRQCLSSPWAVIIITRARLQRAAGKSHAPNGVSILDICRVLGHLR